MKLARKTVAPLAAKSIQETMSLSIEKNFNPDNKKLVSLFNRRAYKLVKNIKNVKINVQV